MTDVIYVRKTALSEAILVETDEDETIVRSWLAAMMGEEDAARADLSDLIKNHVWFMRDEGSYIVYVTPPADFLSNFEEIEPETESTLEDDLKNITDTFRLDDS